MAYFSRWLIWSIFLVSEAVWASREMRTMKQTRFVTAQARRLFAELKRDRRRLAVVAVLLAVGIVVAVRAMILVGGPVSAQAASKRPAAAKSIAAAESQSHPTTAERAEYISGINRNLTRDLFQPNEKFFPIPPAPTPRVKESPVVMTTTAPSEDVHQEVLRRHTLAEARALKLHSTMSGSRTVASVNDQMLSVGDQIAGFRVTDIQSGSCTVEKNGVSVLLTIE
ncbi:MAG: hypothetical protein FWE88_05405 [Phycisphaerae bacterium]|nr:hypothetical protein [Phycisphaerae bacterium]